MNQNLKGKVGSGPTLNPKGTMLSDTNKNFPLEPEGSPKAALLPSKREWRSTEPTQKPKKGGSGDLPLVQPLSRKLALRRQSAWRQGSCK